MEASLVAENAIEFEAFSFAYPNETMSVGPVDWSIKQGDFVLFVGNTGTGKTTLMSCLKPEIAPTGHREGSIRLFGKQLSDYSSYESAQKIGYVFQNPETQLVCSSVWHELAFGLENLGVDEQTMRRRVAEVVHFFGIEPWLEAETDQLSGGQKQLVNLASVLALRPQLLILDEPTSQLDPVATRNFLHELFRVNRELGITILMATHEPDAALEYANEVAVLENGSVLIQDIQTWRDKQKGRVAALNTYLNQAVVEIESQCKKTKCSLIARDLHVRYSKDARFVLRGLDLNLFHTDIHALVGGNGSGKSTLLSTLCGSLKASRGSIKNAYEKKQAFLPQDPKALFTADTVFEEMQEWQYSCGYSNEDIEAYLQTFSLADRKNLHPYDLSGGQKQLLALAKLLITQPKLLFLDEPTKGLDVLAKQKIARILKQEQEKGTTIFLTTHDLSFALAIADKVSMMFDGRIVCTQESRAFFADNMFYRPVPDSFFETWMISEDAGTRITC